LGVRLASNIDDLLEESDIVSFHVALTPETKHLLSSERIAKLKTGAIVLNSSRGAIIDAAALAIALKNGRIRAGLDVYENESASAKGEFNNILAGVPNWVGTHHVGASTSQAQTATASETVRIIEKYVKTGIVENCVNFAKQTPAVYELIVRHYDKMGVLTRILTELRESKVNVHEVHNIIFEGAKAAVAHVQVDTYPSTATLDRLLARKDEIINVKIVKLQPFS
jgi:D-3-phosphoglycerate dehydrogenase